MSAPPVGTPETAPPPAPVPDPPVPLVPPHLFQAFEFPGNPNSFSSAAPGAAQPPVKGVLYSVGNELQLLAIRLKRSVLMALSLPGLPNCAVPCINDTLSLTICDPRNLTIACLCQDQGFQHAFGGCVLGHCDVFDSLTAKNVTLSHCGVLPRYNTGDLEAALFVSIITLVVFIARFISKSAKLTPWGADDFTIVIGFACAITFAVAKFNWSYFEIGVDFWTLSYDEIVRFSQTFYAFALVYILAVASLKATMLFFYQRVFGAFNSTFTAVLWGTQVFNLLAFIAFFLATLFQCRPISFVWYGWDGHHEGACLDVHAIMLSHGAVNVALDFWMLVLPATQVLRLNLRKRQKAEILAMFGIGILITAVSTIRLVVVWGLSFQNPTYDTYYGHLWSFVELSVSVIISCLPPTRQLLRHLIPKFLRAVGLKASDTHVREEPGESGRAVLYTGTYDGHESESPTSAEGFMTPRR